jgi:dTDP-4-amino-4,6-dideoxygalactose transaminase
MKDKNCLADLAIFNGPPLFKEPLHVGRPNIGNRERLLERIEDLLDRRWLTNDGPYLQEFEQKIAQTVGVKYCVAMCNGTIALEILLRALGITSEVIVPSFTFAATAHALQIQGIKPVFCDIEKATHNIDPTKVEALITPKTSAILGVHLWGQACNIDALMDICKRHDLKLIFDAAHAFGCSYKSLSIGSFGNAEVFSFHATKFFNSFEGGAIVTNDEHLARQTRLMRNFGFAGYDNVISIGTNGKMCEIAAAMGLTSFESIDEFISINRRNYRQYQEELSAISGVKLLTYDENERLNYQYIVLEINENSAGIGRDQLLNILQAENVIARRYFYPGCHRMEPYRSMYQFHDLDLSHTNEVASQVLVLPTGSAVDCEAIQKICFIIRFVVENSAAITSRLNKQLHIS